MLPASSCSAVIITAQSEIFVLLKILENKKEKKRKMRHFHLDGIGAVIALQWSLSCSDNEKS